MSSTAIADYALISDRHSAALVSRDGSVDWLCFPRFDSPSVFARLLDGAAGHWSVRPSVPYEATRHYVDRSMVLETTFRTGSGTVTLTDALLTGPDGDAHSLGAGAPRLLARRLTCTEGEVPMETEYRPRPEYGLVAPILSETEGGVTSRGGAEWLVLTAAHRMDFADSTAHGAFTLRAGQSVCLGLQRSTLEEPPAHVWTQEDLSGRLDATIGA